MLLFVFLMLKISFIKKIIKTVLITSICILLQNKFMIFLN